MDMLEPAQLSAFDYPIVCHAEVDLPSWLQQLTGKAGWRLRSDEEGETYDVYLFLSGACAAEVVLYHTGYATVDVDGRVVYDGHLTAAPGFARLQYYNADSGEPILLS